LCPATESRSTPSSSTSAGIFPTDCAASVWNETPASRAMAEISGIGSIVPTSLFACMTVMRIVLDVRDLRTSSGSTIQNRSTGSTVTFAPSLSRNRQGWIVAGCSTPPLVKTASAGSHPAGQIGVLALKSR